MRSPAEATTCKEPQRPGYARTMQRKPRCARRGIDRLGHARGRAIAPAVVRRAQVRAALHDLARDADADGLTGSQLCSRSPPRGLSIVQHACLDLHRGAWYQSRRPLPHVAGHVVQPVAVRSERADRRCALEAVAPPGSRQGNSPCHVLAIVPTVRARARRPRRTRRRPARRARRTPTRPRSAAPCRPSARRPRHPRTRRGRPGVFDAPRIDAARAAGCRQSAPGT